MRAALTDCSAYDGLLLAIARSWPAKSRSAGLVAEWLRSGLQIRVPEFDSRPGLQFPIPNRDRIRARRIEAHAVLSEHSPPRSPNWPRPRACRRRSFKRSRRSFAFDAAWQRSVVRRFAWRARLSRERSARSCPNHARRYGRMRRRRSGRFNSARCTIYAARPPASTACCCRQARYSASGGRSARRHADADTFQAACCAKAAWCRRSAAVFANSPTPSTTSPLQSGAQILERHAHSRLVPGSAAAIGRGRNHRLELRGSPICERTRCSAHG